MQELARQKKQLKIAEKDLKGKFNTYENADIILKKEQDDIKNQKDQFNKFQKEMLKYSSMNGSCMTKDLEKINSTIQDQTISEDKSTIDMH